MVPVSLHDLPLTKRLTEGPSTQRLLRLSMEDPTPPLDTPGIGGWDPVSKPGCLKALNQSGASGEEQTDLPGTIPRVPGGRKGIRND